MSIKIDHHQQDIDRQTNKSTRVRIDYDMCESTGTCALVCPEDVFKHENGRTEVVKMEACTDCWACVDNCVSGAVELE